MGFSRVHFTPAQAKGLTCPQCGHPLRFSRSCLEALLVCEGCGARFDPARFVDQLDEDFDEIYADVPIDRM